MPSTYTLVVSKRSEQQSLCCRDEILNYEEGKTVEELPKDTELQLGPPGPPFGIVINGTSLVRNTVTQWFAILNYLFCAWQRHALKMEDILLETASHCQAVICCRVTPLQKVYWFFVCTLCTYCVSCFTRKKWWIW